MPNQELHQLRAHFPVLENAVYMNTGTQGPLPDVVAGAMRQIIDRQLAEPRTGAAYFAGLQEGKAALRGRLARLLGCADSELALTHNTTEGMNFVTLGVNWVRGDEAITTNVEHPGALLPLWVVKERYGVTVKTADVASQPENAAEAVLRHVTARTKLISLSHVSFSTGNVLPVAQIAAAAHERGILVLVDGAQSFGAIPLDMSDLGVDFYAIPGQKWLCGPEGTGALYSRQEVVSQIRTTFASYGTMDGYNDYGGFLVKEDGRRFEQGTMQLADIAGHAAACEFLTETIGEDWAYKRIDQLASLAAERLAAVPGVRVVTDASRHAGLVTFTVAGRDPDEMVGALAERAILVRSIQRPSAVRLSLGYFNTDDEVEQVAATVGELLRR
jgi:L-cysteine/cystine lyase